MENNRDEHITCADCGASFLFSAGEAAVFEQRGLASPKRCKDCRQARKQQGGGAQRGPRNGGGGFRDGNAAPRSSAPRPFQGGGDRSFQGGGARGGGFRQGPPRYTGDVNEYRSPMQDGGWQQQQQAPRWQQGQGQAPARRPAGPPRRGGPGIYRGPDEYRAPTARVEAAERPPRPMAKPRPQGEMFSITCDSCGSQAEVPFKPAEGREVFCQPCYRARKPVAP